MSARSEEVVRLAKEVAEGSIVAQATERLIYQIVEVCAEHEKEAVAKALMALPCGHHASLEIRSVESDYRACELCEARHMQRDAETMEVLHRKERDAAYELLREASPWLSLLPESPLRARIVAVLDDAP